VIPPVAPEVAYVRAVPDAFADCLRPVGVSIDVARARTQHAGYVAALRAAGAVIRWLPPAPTLADAVFVEDVAVVLPGNATLITRPGAPSRVPEVASAETQLAARGPVEVLPDGAYLDGGDVMRWGDTYFVGLSDRTNAVAVAAFAEIGTRRGFSVVGVRVRAGLHLKSACTVLDEHSVLCLPDRLDLDALREAGLDPITAPEEAGANVLAFGTRVLVSTAAPRTAELAAARGFEPISVEIEQFHRGDGALSCLSLRVAPRGRWCV
jgi:dimethylargininase